MHFYSGDLGNRIVDNILRVVEQQHYHQAKPLIGRNPQSGGGDEEDEDGGMHAVTTSQCAAAHDDAMSGRKKGSGMGRQLCSEDESPEIGIQVAGRSPTLTMNTIDPDKAKEFHVDEHHAEEWVDTEVDLWGTTEAKLSFETRKRIKSQDAQVLAIARSKFLLKEPSSLARK